MIDHPICQVEPWFSATPDSGSGAGRSPARGGSAAARRRQAPPRLLSSSSGRTKSPRDYHFYKVQS